MAAGVPVRRTPTGRPSPFGFHVLPDGRAVEVGCKLLELSYEPGDYRNDSGPLAEFRPGSQHGHRPWIWLIADYVRNLIDIGPEISRSVQRDRQYYADPFLSGDPTSMVYLLSGRENYDAVGQLERIAANGVRGCATFQEQVAENCGEVIYRAVIWPLLHKIAGWTDIPAAQHRKVWLPLWRPESLLDALRGEPSYQPVRPMHFGCGALVEALETVTKDATAGTRGFWQGSTLSFDLADVDSSGAGAPVGIAVPRPRSVPIGVAWVEDDHPDGTEWLIDTDVPVFRRTWRGGLCAVEHAAGANIDRWAYETGFTVLDRMEVRVQIGDVRCDDPRAIGYGNLNDQIVSGLAAADRLMKERA